LLLLCPCCRLDGSRHLVSNTTSVKVLAADLGCPRCGAVSAV
jgi:hypothetical protein